MAAGYTTMSRIKKLLNFRMRSLSMCVDLNIFVFILINIYRIVYFNYVASLKIFIKAYFFFCISRWVYMFPKRHKHNPIKPSIKKGNREVFLRLFDLTRLLNFVCRRTLIRLKKNCSIFIYLPQIKCCRGNLNLIDFIK